MFERKYNETNFGIFNNNRNIFIILIKKKFKLKKLFNIQIALFYWKSLFNIPLFIYLWL